MTGITRSALRSRRAGATALVLLALSLVPGTDAAAQDLTVEATVPLGGIVRAGRWTPLLVTVESSRPSFVGALHVTWGDARLRRDIELASPGRRVIEVYLKALEPAAAIHVALQTGTAITATADTDADASVDVPVRVLRLDETFTLCAGPDISADVACTATIEPGLLPRSPRGYEAIDRVVWSARGGSETREQRAAVEAWERLHHLEQSGDAGLAPQPARPEVRRGLPDDVTGRLGALSLVYLGGLGAVGVLAVSRRINLAATAAATAALTIGACAFITGHQAGGDVIAVRHSTVLQQIPRSAVSAFAMRGIVEFPALGRYRVELPVPDASLERATARDRAAHEFGVNGLPMLDGTFALGGRQAFVAEGVLRQRPIDVERKGDAVVIANRSPAPLRACRFADGVSAGSVDVLQPGATVTARRTGPVVGPLLTCETDVAPEALRSSGAGVEMRGITIVVVYDDTEQAGATDLSLTQGDGNGDG